MSEVWRSDGWSRRPLRKPTRRERIRAWWRGVSLVDVAIVVGVGVFLAVMVVIGAVR